ncbi:MAG: site-specific DNA-methyltransferase, partial [Deltaproteobacteria bacterium]|nr:site-specific DNA-methyltransferase [Deltaproteobacteria bacterium]
MPKKPASEKKIESFVHDDASRRNIPPAEYQTMVRNQEKTPLQVAYERRNPDLDPQLIWRGKDLLDDSPLVVNAPPLYIQEKIHPKVLIDDLKRRGKEGAGEAEQIDLFSAFNGLQSEEAKTEFYQHDQNWSNRMILGDSLQVMASLAEREGLRGQVQCIYFDPPYGIKFNSNFQWSTTNRDVKDGKADQITREPEQVKAFRDTWRDGVNSYLAYLRDRLHIARELLTESGSLFTQIGDENVHLVRCVLEEVFGAQGFVSQIITQKTGGFSASSLANTNDYILWFCKDLSKLKFRPSLEIAE